MPRNFKSHLDRCEILFHIDSYEDAVQRYVSLREQLDRGISQSLLTTLGDVCDLSEDWNVRRIGLLCRIDNIELIWHRTQRRGSWFGVARYFEEAADDPDPTVRLLVSNAVACAGRGQQTLDVLRETVLDLLNDHRIPESRPVHRFRVSPFNGRTRRWMRALRGTTARASN